MPQLIFTAVYDLHIKIQIAHPVRGGSHFFNGLCKLLAVNIHGDSPGYNQKSTHVGGKSPGQHRTGLYTFHRSVDHHGVAVVKISEKINAGPGRFLVGPAHYGISFFTDLPLDLSHILQRADHIIVHQSLFALRRIYDLSVFIVDDQHPVIIFSDNL